MIEVGTRFVFVGDERHVNVWRGAGWYASVRGYDGGPWHLSNRGRGPWRVRVFAFGASAVLDLHRDGRLSVPKEPR